MVMLASPTYDQQAHFLIHDYKTSSLTNEKSIEPCNCMTMYVNQNEIVHINAKKLLQPYCSHNHHHPHPHILSSPVLQAYTILENPNTKKQLKDWE